MKFVCLCEPMGKPRMTQRDKWMKRKCVMRYRALCDELRRCAGPVPVNAHTLIVKAWLSFPKSYSKKVRAHLEGLPHQVKPDADNCLKLTADALFDDDSKICHMEVWKFWDDGHGSRLEVEVLP